MDSKVLNGNVLDIDFAGPWRRVVALLIDGILMAVVLNLVLRPNTFPGLIDFKILGAVVLYVVYEALMVYYRGATVGKLAMGIIVVDSQSSEKPSLIQSIIRPWSKLLFGLVILNSSLINLVFVVFGLANFSSMALDENRQALYDKVAKTAVLRN